LTNDVRALLASPDPRAKFALDCFVRSAAKGIGAMAAALGGADALVFTAGIGENSPEIRARIVEASAWLGVKLDPAANAKHGPRISTAESRVSAWVVPTNEDLMIARHTARML
jgi:acetate kinase